ncbi:MAG: phage tail protein [Myxococcota bacterium]
MSFPYVGEIRLFAGNFPPSGWAFCDGQLLSVAGNETLFQLIGTTYGGDGAISFALPDLRGRVPIHIGQGAGLSPFDLAQRGGTETMGGVPTALPTGFGTQRNLEVSVTAGKAQYLTTDSKRNALAISYIISLFGVFPSQN